MYCPPSGYWFLRARLTKISSRFGFQKWFGIREWLSCLAAVDTTRSTLTCLRSGSIRLTNLVSAVFCTYEIEMNYRRNFWSDLRNLQMFMYYPAGNWRIFCLTSRLLLPSSMLNAFG